MKSNRKIIDIYSYMPVLQDLLSQGREVSITITGNSMSPFLIDGRDEILISPFSGSWKKGDMAFFQRTNGKYIMHRICRVEKNGDCFFVGDAQQLIEGPIKPSQIFGKITSVKRKGKWIGPGNFWWEFFEHIWLNMIPLRPVCRILYTKLWYYR